MLKTFFLVLHIGSTGVTTIPIPYPTEQLCNEAGDTFRSTMSARWYYCVPHWEDPSLRRS